MSSRNFGSFSAIAAAVCTIIFSFSTAQAQGQLDGTSGTNPFGQQNQTQYSSNPADRQQANQTQSIGDGTQQQGSFNGNNQNQQRGSNLQNQLDDERYRDEQRTAPLNTSGVLNQLPPDELTEFQRVVRSSIGRMLPIYGARLFLNAPSTYAPLDHVPVTPDYVVGPGDELLIQVWGQVTLNSRFTVDRTGNIFIPQVGTVHVAGLPFAKLQSHLQSQMAKVFRNFDLNVNMGQLRSIQIFVVGQARRPGSYTLSSLSTLVDALFVTGGPTPQGSLRHVQLQRSGQMVVDFDLYDLLQKGDKSKDVHLLPGDVIYIPPVGAQVAVAGSVNLPAIYELKSPTDSTVDEVLALAAGPTNVAAYETLRLERIDAHTMRSVTEISLPRDGQSTRLRDGDILELVSVTDRFSNGVTLRGNVANPGRYSWKPGMRVRDLFPDKDSLITRDYWLRRGTLGEPTLLYTPNCPANAVPAPSPRSPTVVPNVPSQVATDCIPANTPLAGLAPASPEYGRLNPADRRADATAATDAASAQSQGSTAAAAVQNSGMFSPRNDVALSAPDIDWSYAVIERQSRQTLSTSLIPFNLGKLVLDGDPSQNLELQPGDVVTIFSKADIRVPQAQQTRFVHLEGEFLSPGTYSVLPGETLQQLIQRAGGLTPDAYLYGSEFTRESTRRTQQQRLNDYIQQLSLQVNTNVANIASRNVSATDAAVASGLQSQNQSIISNLRQARASGRIVLNFDPFSKSLAQVPPLSLEDADTFIVPSTPSTVSVAGAVYNPNSFLYVPNLPVVRYLNLAGGANRQADTKRAYIIRADGSVISQQQVSSRRRIGFKSLRMYPGDTLVVPLNLDRGASLRTVVDIAQIIGQFGLAIAAASVVF